MTQMNYLIASQMMRILVILPRLNYLGELPPEDNFFKRTLIERLIAGNVRVTMIAKKIVKNNSVHVTCDKYVNVSNCGILYLYIPLTGFEPVFSPRKGDVLDH